MTEKLNDFKTRVAAYQVRERIFALLVLCVIAVVAMMRIDDPENIVINIIVAIGAYSAGKGDSRSTDKPKDQG